MRKAGRTSCATTCRSPVRAAKNAAPTARLLAASLGHRDSARTHVHRRSAAVARPGPTGRRCVCGRTCRRAGSSALAIAVFRNARLDLRSRGGAEPRTLLAPDVSGDDDAAAGPDQGRQDPGASVSSPRQRSSIHRSGLMTSTGTWKSANRLSLTARAFQRRIPWEWISPARASRLLHESESPAQFSFTPACDPAGAADDSAEIRTIALLIITLLGTTISLPSPSTSTVKASEIARTLADSTPTGQ